ncbi:MAG: carboxypeptidase-like regulatory domain-containing protein [Candidatus Bathyarchaeota archaeon]|nr:carboxypeptidase-like regulatory domain-containing protein [Candidatus Bathyarchaeota archaeon]
MRNKKIAAVTILLLVSFAMLLTPEAAVSASSSVKILELTPSNARGSYGTSVNLGGTIATENGSYRVVLGKTVVATGVSDGNYVNANFTVPELPSNLYPLILQDVAANVNSTQQFSVTIGYSVSASPTTVQEGSKVTLEVAVTGTELGVSYAATVAVSLPSAAGGSYSKTVSLSGPNQRGTSSAQVSFPDSGFSEGANMDYTGAYTATFNQSLAQTQFAVGVLDQTVYHRGDTASIKATGYQPNQEATVTITTRAGETVDSKTATASAEGVISLNWIIPSNIPIGTNNIKITPTGTQKAIVDHQAFTVAGYTVKVQTTNLAGDSVPDILVKAKDTSSLLETNSTSDEEGSASFKLEKGIQALTAYLEDVKVAEANITVTGDGNFTLTCQLTNIEILVQNVDGAEMSYVNLAISFNYQSSSGGVRKGSSSGITDPSGRFRMKSALAGATYTIDASIYNQVFNEGNNTANNLPSKAISQILIVCPNQNVTINVKGFNQEAIPNARIELVELSNGLFYSATTDGNGSVTTQPTLGVYRLRIFKDNTLLNESSVPIFSDRQDDIRCTLYGIQLFVSVVDLFGAPIPNMQVTLKGPEKVSAITPSDGKVSFNNIMGGNMLITAQSADVEDASQAVTVTVNEPTVVQIKIDRYVSVGGTLIQASTLITMIIILVAAALFMLVEVYRRQRRKPTS